MYKRVVEGLQWRYWYLQRWLFLLRSFRNGPELISAFRKKKPIQRAVRWNGQTIIHPDQRGLVETILEIWFEGVYTSGFYHPKPNDVVIDAGANIGLFSLWISRIEPKTRIFAFEPFQENFEYFERNLNANQPHSVIANRSAIGGQSGRAQICRVGDRSLDHRISKAESANGDEVAILSMADAIALGNDGRIALFKMDIEGSEFEAFRDSDPEDLKRVERFAIEHHEHLHTGLVQLICSKLEPTHHVTIKQDTELYGMLYAVRKDLSSR
jgi:FkbM family methyltransferase